MCQYNEAAGIQQWVDKMDGKPAWYEFYHTRARPTEPNSVPSRMFEAEDAGWSPNRHTLEAVALHLETCRYTDEAYHAGRLPAITVDQLDDVHFEGWRAYHHSSDLGSQRWRISRNDADRRNLRDASWATVCLIALSYAHCAFMMLDIYSTRKG
jgi:hypothetical protein